MTLSPLQSDAPVIVYIDFKSPYAYLAIEPTRELERRLNLAFDWRPFVLDIPSYLGSAKLNKSGKVVEQNRSAQQWSGVKYAYYDCRRYARTRGLTIRGTEKIWNTQRVATAMWWARQRGRPALDAFIDAIYPPFWVRDLDVESEAVLVDVLDAIGADGTGFRAWANAEGYAQNSAQQDAAFAAGIYGVPSYVVGDEIYFGREHLERIAWELTGQHGPAPDIRYTLHSEAEVDCHSPEAIWVGIDDSLDSLLGIPNIAALAARKGLPCHWVRVPPRKPFTPPAEDDVSRSAMHKRHRVRHAQDCERRYGVAGVAQDYRAAVDEVLREQGIALSVDPPGPLHAPPMPGMAVLLGEELFVGRHHLPMLAARLGG